MAIFFVAPVIQAALVASVVQASRVIGREPGDRGKIVKAFVVLAILFLILSASPAATDCPLRSWIAVNEASVMASLRTLNTAQVTYGSTYNSGFTDTLTKLCSPDNGPPDAKAADLLDPLMCGKAGDSGTVFRKNGYIFTYTPGPHDSHGRVAAYTISARPAEYQKSGVRSFFTDQSSVIRATAENRAATAHDQPL
jgi:hypothetical protein